MGLETDVSRDNDLGILFREVPGGRQSSLFLLLQVLVSVVFLGFRPSGPLHLLEAGTPESKQGCEGTQALEGPPGASIR